MSGFIGIIRNNPVLPTDEQQHEFKEQYDVMMHREADGEAYYGDGYVLLGYSQPNTSVADSSAQPLGYQDENIWIVLNGSIYNGAELRNDLLEQGYRFTMATDTEVVAALFTHWKEQAFQYLRGMFAVLIWDKESSTMYGARDPFGAKMLYYCETEKGTVLSTEKKSITHMQGDTVREAALQHYLSFQYVPEPMTMTEGINKIEPGHYVVKKPGKPMSHHRYWKAGFTPVLTDRQYWINRIQDALYESVKIHMQGNAPVGSFLSGGIDSTLIVALAKEFNPAIKTFSVGFERARYTEVGMAKETADKLGVDNISYIISPQEFVEKLPTIMWHMDDPLADPACVPLYFVAREARQHVTTALSGEGADELFGGYNIYREPSSLKMFESVPGPAKELLARVAGTIPEGVRGKSFLQRGTTPLRDRYIGNAKIFPHEEKRHLLKNWKEDLVDQQITAGLFDEASHYPLVDQMQYVDIHTWLRSDILLKADKMTKANSLEVRMPYLDKEVFRIASELPTDMKIANGTTKRMLREAARGIIPDDVLDRKKLGFPVPIRYWLKNELYDWARELIQASGTDHLLYKSYVLNLLDAHCQGQGDYSRKIWTVLMFMLWHQIFVEQVYDHDELSMPDPASESMTSAG